jgi:hypothetical protein
LYKPHNIYEKKIKKVAKIFAYYEKS